MIQGIDAIHARLEEFLSRRRSNNVELALSVKEEEIEKIIKKCESWSRQNNELLRTLKIKPYLEILKFCAFVKYLRLLNKEKAPWLFQDALVIASNYT